MPCVRACVWRARYVIVRTVTRVRSRETAGLFPPTPWRGKLMTTRSLCAPREISQMASRVSADRLERNWSEGGSINFFQCTPRESVAKSPLKRESESRDDGFRKTSTYQCPIARHLSSAWQLDVAVVWYAETGRMLIGKTRKRATLFYAFLVVRWSARNQLNERRLCSRLTSFSLVLSSPAPRSCIKLDRTKKGTIGRRRAPTAKYTHDDSLNHSREPRGF